MQIPHTRPEQGHYVPISENPACIACKSVPVVCLSNNTSPAFLQHLVSTFIPEEEPFDVIDPESSAEIQGHMRKFGHDS